MVLFEFFFVCTVRTSSEEHVVVVTIFFVFLLYLFSVFIGPFTSCQGMSVYIYYKLLNEKKKKKSNETISYEEM